MTCPHARQTCPACLDYARRYAEAMAPLFRGNPAYPSRAPVVENTDRSQLAALSGYVEPRAPIVAALRRATDAEVGEELLRRREERAGRG